MKSFQQLQIPQLHCILLAISMKKYWRIYLCLFSNRQEFKYFTVWNSSHLSALTHFIQNPSSTSPDIGSVQTEMADLYFLCGWSMLYPKLNNNWAVMSLVWSGWTFLCLAHLLTNLTYWLFRVLKIFIWKFLWNLLVHRYLSVVSQIDTWIHPTWP